MTVLEYTDRLDAIGAQAREVHVGRLILAFIAATLILLGRSVGGVVNGLVWAALAVREGYRDARAPRRKAGAG